MFKNFMINELGLLQRLFWYQQKKAINYFLQASWSRQCCYGCLTSHKRMTPLLQNSSTDFTKVSLIMLGCKIFLIINCQDYLYQEMELGEHKNGNHSSGGQGQGGASKPSPDPVGNVASGTVHLCRGHWGHGEWGYFEFKKKYLTLQKRIKSAIIWYQRWFWA